MVEQQQGVSINRIYVKDVSFEVPHAPGVFNDSWKPEAHLDISVINENLQNDKYEVQIKLILTVKAANRIAFLVEVAQAGIFTIKGFVEEQLENILNVYCPNILFPYARETVDSLISRGTFPPPHLIPINFELLLNENKKQGTAAASFGTDNEFKSEKNDKNL